MKRDSRGRFVPDPWFKRIDWRWAVALLCAVVVSSSSVVSCRSIMNMDERSRINSEFYREACELYLNRRSH